MKKALAGEISTIQLYEECLSLGVNGEASISLREDNTRSHSSHDVNVDELRDLIQSFVAIDQGKIPRIFQVSNCPFIRRVFILHISDCEDFTFLEELKKIYTNTLLMDVRICKNQTFVSSFPQKLLTISNTESAQSEISVGDGRDGGEWHRVGDGRKKITKPSLLLTGETGEIDLSSCVMSASTMTMWGYPLPLQLADDTAAEGSSTRDKEYEPETYPHALPTVTESNKMENVLLLNGLSSMKRGAIKMDLYSAMTEAEAEDGAGQGRTDGEPPRKHLCSTGYENSAVRERNSTYSAVGAEDAATSTDARITTVVETLSSEIIAATAIATTAPTAPAPATVLDEDMLTSLPGLEQSYSNTSPPAP